VKPTPTLRHSVGRAPVFIGLAIGALLLWVALRHADLDSAMSALAGADPGWCLAVLAAGPLFMALKTARWAVLLGPVVTPAFGVLHRAVYVGSAANMVVPHTGEVLRALSLSRAGLAPTASGLGSVAIERVLDMLAVVLLATTALTTDQAVPDLLWVGSLAGLCIALAGGVVVFFVPDPPGPLRRLWQATFARWLPGRARHWVEAQIRHLGAGFASAREPRRVLLALLLSLAMWSCVVFAVWASTRAVGLDPGLTAVITVFVLGVVGLTLPSAPGAVGATQLSFVAGLALDGAPASPAFAASLVYTIWFIVSVMAIGGLWWLAPSPAAARRAAHTAGKDRASSGRG
jgi:uncharacterized protein (TIRG00374 family)